MQSDTHRAFAHCKLLCRLLDRYAVDGDRLQHIALTRRQPFRWVATSPGGSVSSAVSPGMTSAKSSMLTKIGDHAGAGRRSACCEAMVNSHGANGAFVSLCVFLQMHREKNLLRYPRIDRRG